ncbi:hypothetical protein C3747_138g78 [Trypanosoma cruzi]|uniref:Uncharacterized protein n=2 Tax=Trypanosoma cruzi TaxID=5693 RepID=Q4CT02_TRYCC|nr:hypothetical protein, conserved [Trypanosoma cruzi]EAN83401.1 hypothetical protein, conserved [Trypanosoma cruzi]PWV05083.1 hypothetical protein C3747_138g78 [Trypanosoma cruzi]RNC52422.1 hypothetical protein TcCL_ESM10355 [Trypanosoma cruzi]|eukprot:XP_805252.1 hypothetical protein [Trypanosoma cruzi strain CL Brener]
MVLHVALLGKSTSTPLTRLDLLEALRRNSPRGYHATRSYLWTEDNLFTTLSPVPLFDVNSVGCCYYAFRAELSCGGNNEDFRVAVMLLLDLTAAVDNLVAIATEKEDVESHEEEESNFLLVELADVLEQSEATCSDYLKRWGAEEHNYHLTMARRVLLAAGHVYSLPLSLPSSPCTPSSYLELQFHFLAMEAEMQNRCREDALTEALHQWANEVERVMREESCHLAVAAVPISVAELLDAHPQLVQTALLHHTIRQPLSWLAVGTQLSSSSTRLEGVVNGVIQEYRVLAQNKLYVRVPLRMSRYSFAYLFFAGLPRVLAEKPLSRTETPLALLSHVGGGGEEVEADERELLLGLQLTIALHRLRFEVKGQHTFVIERFLQELQCRNEKGDVAEITPENASLRRELDRLRRKLMPVATMRGDSIDWMRSYAQEAAMDYNVTEKEIDRLEVSMLDNSESGTLSADDADDAFSNKDDEAASGVSQQLEEMDSFLGARMCEAVLSGSDVEEAALTNVADNFLFLETVQMLAQDDIPAK